MSRVPCCLLYLAIYNPTLRPKHPIDDDDEDAEEQAHILFYTSKERAVSRDRMLRQIGLSKALVNFTELFNPNDKCESIHSQARRIILVSPEPNFWINACVELPKTLQASSPSKNAGKSKSKTAAKEKDAQPPVYDYEDGTVHDIAVRSQLLHAYERFKLIHGSFTSILAELGQEALELQLERFFTVWAWSWNLEAKAQIADQLGLPLQPYYSALIPLLDRYSATLPEHVAPIVLSQTHIIPSTRYISGEYPDVLVERLMSMVPPPAPHTEDPLAASVDTIQPVLDSDSPGSKAAPTGLFGLPAVNVNMDVRKWNWNPFPFGKGGSKPAEEGAQDIDEQKETNATPPEQPSRDGIEQGHPSDPTHQETTEVQVDSKALEEALASDGLSPTPQPETKEPEEDQASQKQEPSEVDTIRIDTDISRPARENSLSVDEENRLLHVDDGTASPQSSKTILPRARFPSSSSRSSSPAPPEFSKCFLHLPSSDDLLVTRKQPVYYYTRNGTMLALIGVDDEETTSLEPDEILTAAQQATEMLDDIELTIQNAALSKLSESLPTAIKILQTPDQYAISTDHYMLQSPGFASDSGHLQNSTALFERDPDVMEVFSRGQNPQYWHVAKRGLSSHDSPTNESGPSRGLAFLEVFKKEASLPDVDNVLAGILRKSGISESGLV